MNTSNQIKNLNKRYHFNINESLSNTELCKVLKLLNSFVKTVNINKDFYRNVDCIKKDILNIEKGNLDTVTYYNNEDSEKILKQIEELKLTNTILEDKLNSIIIKMSDNIKADDNILSSTKKDKIEYIENNYGDNSNIKEYLKNAMSKYFNLAKNDENDIKLNNIISNNMNIDLHSQLDLSMKNKIIELENTINRLENVSNSKNSDYIPNFNIKCSDKVVTSSIHDSNNVNDNYETIYNMYNLNDKNSGMIYPDTKIKIEDLFQNYKMKNNYKI